MCVITQTWQGILFPNWLEGADYLGKQVICGKCWWILIIKKINKQPFRA